MLPYWSFFWHFLPLVLMAMKMPRHSFSFVTEQGLCVWTGNTLCNLICVCRMGGCGQAITSCRLEGPTCKEWPVSRLPRCWGTVGILSGWSLQGTPGGKSWRLHHLLWAGQSAHYPRFKMEMWVSAASLWHFWACSWLVIRKEGENRVLLGPKVLLLSWVSKYDKLVFKWSLL